MCRNILDHAMAERLDSIRAAIEALRQKKEAAVAQQTNGPNTPSSQSQSRSPWGPAVLPPSPSPSTARSRKRTKTGEDAS